MQKRYAVITTESYIRSSYYGTDSSRSHTYLFDTLEAARATLAELAQRCYRHIVEDGDGASERVCATAPVNPDPARLTSYKHSTNTFSIFDDELIATGCIAAI